LHHQESFETDFYHREHEKKIESLPEPELKSEIASDDSYTEYLSESEPKSESESDSEPESELEPYPEPYSPIIEDEDESGMSDYWEVAV